MKYRLDSWFAICCCALWFAGPAAAAAPAQSAELKALNDQVATLYRQGKYGEAMNVAKMAVDIGQADLGPNHPEVAQSLTNLAALHQALGQNAEAEPLLKRALAILEKAFGPDHPTVATVLDALAELYRVQGKTAEAAPLEKRLLAIRKNAPAPKSPPAAVASAITNAPAPAAQALPPAVVSAPRAPGSAPKYNDLITAVMLQDEAAVRDLLDFGKWIDVQSESGFTPVMIAAKLGNLGIAQLLLARGADPNHRNQSRMSAMDYARQNRDDRMVSLLRSKGARD